MLGAVVNARRTGVMFDPFVFFTGASMARSRYLVFGPFVCTLNWLQFRAPNSLSQWNSGLRCNLILVCGCLAASYLCRRCTQSR